MRLRERAPLVLLGACLITAAAAATFVFLGEPGRGLASEGFRAGAGRDPAEDRRSEPPAFCRMTPPPVEVDVPLAEAPSYFAKITPDGTHMAFILDEGNFLLNLRSPRTMLHVPGPFDPVPSPDGRLLTIPDSSLKFYDLPHLLELAREGETVETATETGLVGEDSDQDSSYQSVGLLAPTPEQPGPVYRVVAGSLFVSDYLRKPDGTLERVGDVRDLCGESSSRYTLPLLSKDGTKIAVFDNDDHVTKILHIEPDDSCTEALNLGIPAGKVEFSHDGRRLAFHMDSFSDSHVGSQFSGMETDMVKNIYVVDVEPADGGRKLVPKTMRRLTAESRLGSAAYYPSFSRQGKVAYIYSRATEDANGETELSYGFRVVDPERARPAPFYLNRPVAAEARKQLAGFYALGELWGRSCQSGWDDLAATDLAGWTLSLDPTACRALVRERWPELRDRILTENRIARTGRVDEEALSALQLEDLLAACPPETAAPPAGGVVSAPTVAGGSAGSGGGASLSAKQIFQNKCLSCHVSGRLAFDWSRLNQGQITKMLERVQSTDRRKRMPPGGSGLNAERDLPTFLEGLREKLATAPPAP